MTVSYALSRAYYQYVSDNGTTYQVCTTKSNGTVNGSTSVTPSTTPPFPPKWKMREVWGINGAQTVSVPVFQPTNTLWQQSTKTFMKDGSSFTITRRNGEYRSWVV